jgi:hypothetical protein
MLFIKLIERLLLECKFSCAQCEIESKASSFPDKALPPLIIPICHWFYENLILPHICAELLYEHYAKKNFDLAAMLVYAQTICIRGIISPKRVGLEYYMSARPDSCLFCAYTLSKRSRICGYFAVNYAWPWMPSANFCSCRWLRLTV